jgi:hypothetical protein
VRKFLLLALLTAPALAGPPATPPAAPEPSTSQKYTVGQEVLFFASNRHPSDYLYGAADGTMATIPGAVKCNFNYIELDSFLAKMGTNDPTTLSIPLAIAVSVIIQKQCEHGTAA